LHEKKGSYSAVFEIVEEKLLCFIFNVEAVLGINISLRVIELHEKKGSYSAIFERVEGKLM
jgi:hypothetical protein